MAAILFLCCQHLSSITTDDIGGVIERVNPDPAPNPAIGLTLFKPFRTRAPLVGLAGIHQQRLTDHAFGN